MRVKIYMGCWRPAQWYPVMAAGYPIMVSVNQLPKRKLHMFEHCIMDSGAFTRIRDGKGHLPVAEYGRIIEHWANCGMDAVVAQDFMCEDFILEKAKEHGFSDGTVKHHQQLTIERYDALMDYFDGEPPVHIMPVLQGYEPHEYIDHIRQYGDRLKEGMWVGVGSVCKRNGRIALVEEVLYPIHEARQDLLLHGFGLKYTALASGIVQDCLYSCDTQAWSYGERMKGGDANSAEVALSYYERMSSLPYRPRQAAMMLPDKRKSPRHERQEGTEHERSRISKRISLYYE